ncbi:Prokaryotic metallothionein [Haloechinothrix halophila]|uniref:Metallothionein family 14 n=1 Tax=Haloechinothrix halophila YIM 93223 TaxID=592678 RepID=W9DN38_9PSEU|nr:Prokaryotic metallothionein [Haloechinothrix halophila]ETA66298.1 metallothionein family 14 [Haloechinothrix halophila YIM 93223]
MAACEVCGNDYWMSFEVRTKGGDVHVFDSIECAAQRIAPSCEHCQCRILGHGVEVDGRFFCCAHCARTTVSKGAEIRDAVGAHPG